MGGRREKRRPVQPKQTNGRRKMPLPRRFTQVPHQMRNPRLPVESFYRFAMIGAVAQPYQTAPAPNYRLYRQRQANSCRVPLRQLRLLCRFPTSQQCTKPLFELFCDRIGQKLSNQSLRAWHRLRCPQPPLPKPPHRHRRRLGIRLLLHSRQQCIQSCLRLRSLCARPRPTRRKLRRLRHLCPFHGSERCKLCRTRRPHAL